jgi:spore germination protein GerM
VQGEDLSVWFASRQQDALVAEKRFIPSGATMIDRAKAALGQLIAGPRTEAQRTLPADVQVRELFVDDLGTAYVDFTEGLRRHHPGGPWAEILTIQSIVQTLTSNVPEIKRVQILIEGREVDSLAGHVDIRGPIAQTWITNRR